MNKTTRTTVTSPITGDQYVRIDHASGLTIYVSEMEGFSTTEALFAAKYGSINTQFKTVHDTDYCMVPEGIAHFLEHKLFENEDCDVFSLYAKTGASANAYTSFEKTAYLFTCSDNYQASLEILLSFVQNPYFTPESVAKEQGIIGQEIRMTNDDPGWRVFFNMLKGLYHSHPVKIDIAGTEESIAEITDDLLYRCYHTFYNLHNMVLSIAGNCKADEVLEIADRLLKPCEDLELEMVFPEEPMSVVSAETIDYAPVGAPIFHLGIKCSPKSGYENLKAEMEAYVAMQILSNASSPLYQSLLEDGLVNDTFSSSIFNGNGYFCIIFDGESEDARTVRTRICDTIRKAQETGLDAELFDEVRKSAYGGMALDMSYVSSAANLMMNAHLNGVKPFDLLEIISKMTLEDVNNFLRNEIDPELSTLSVVMNPSADTGKEPKTNE
ncbi:MAG: insulinase family protein [Ruminococcus sp.]|nr:insulinase family protein [Ruminococcus sp.]